MSLFNKVFASIGIGSATVDTRFEKDSFMPGEEVRGVVHVKGGNVEQQIEDIYLSLNTTYLKESDDRKHTMKATIERFNLSKAFVILPNEMKEIPFTFCIPLDTPVSIGRTKIWMETGVDIKSAVDPSDKDYIKVIPNPLMEAVLNTVPELGFRLREADCEEVPYHKRRRMPFVQEFEFVPISGPYRGRLDELEVVLFPLSGEELEIVLQVDRKARGLGGFLAEALEMDETNVKILVNRNDLSTIKSKLQSVIEQYS